MCIPPIPHYSHIILASVNSFSIRLHAALSRATLCFQRHVISSLKISLSLSPHSCVLRVLVYLRVIHIYCPLGHFICSFHGRHRACHNQVCRLPCLHHYCCSSFDYAFDAPFVNYCPSTNCCLLRLASSLLGHLTILPCTDPDGAPLLSRTLSPTPLPSTPTVVLPVLSRT